VVPELALTDRPVFHDVQQTDDDFWSGELLCTLTVLTPLVVGNYQFDYQALSENLKATYRKLLVGRGLSQGERPAEDKKVIEPLCLPSGDGPLPGRVLISGESLKGMVRQSLQALLSAPIERVQERILSFRPNIQMVTASRNVEVLPALVVEGGGWSQNEPRRPNSVKLLVLEGLQDIHYVHPDAEDALPKPVRDLLGKPAETRSAHYADPGKRKSLCLEDTEAKEAAKRVHLTPGKILKPGRGRTPPNLAGLLPVVNLNGIDLEARLNELFHERHEGPANELRTRSPHGYRFLLLRLPQKGTPVQLDAPALKAFYDSLEQLADDTAGHLRDHPLLKPKDKEEVANRIRAFRRRGLLPGDVVFIERRLSSGSISSLGHHFYFRKRYRDSIHRTDEESYRSRHQKNPVQDLRDILCPRPLEQQTTQEGGPEQLSGARLLFGFVGTSQGKYSPSEPLAFGIGWSQEAQRRGRSDFAQLAGRVSFNMAVEQGDLRRTGRFLHQKDFACLVPLRPLGSPKPSAVEVYLTQNRLSERRDLGTLCTYGDTADDRSAGNLRGRKFYLHQPDAAKDPKCYELIDPSQPDWKSGQTVHLLGNQAAIARFVSPPGTEFRFTLRFRDLRSWELGALLFTLTADQDLIERLVQGLGLSKPPERLANWLQRIRQWPVSGKCPLLALKLGHGRPLGLGSVAIRVDQVRRLRFDEPEWTPKLETCDVEEVRQETVDKLSAKLKAFCGAASQRWVIQVLLPWLQIHRYAGRTRFDYPRDNNDGTIFSFHSEERKKHAKGRKLSKGPGVASPGPRGLKSLDDLDR
jgi:CRISPR-associated protein (TIGR03986 family)